MMVNYLLGSAPSWHNLNGSIANFLFLTRYIFHVSPCAVVFMSLSNVITFIDAQARGIVRRLSRLCAIDTEIFETQHTCQHTLTPLSADACTTARSGHCGRRRGEVRRKLQVGLTISPARG